MYESFFGLKEKPFKLVPNPAYLFLSRCHEEALAHLKYAISQKDGFVLITGSAGCGKTTICRTFIESLSQYFEIAYVFNPKLDSIQLLKAINDEFGICADKDNSRDLINVFNSFLIKKKAEGKDVILLIDEAHNLSKDVLEQIRLLSNLETTTSKLLQIILVGQPELEKMLDSQELMQLKQRITLSCYLTPLNIAETNEYIWHRLNLASKNRTVQFTKPAVYSIYKYSKGIPRLINIACDRTLLYAFIINKNKITKSIAKAAIAELSNKGYKKLYSFVKLKKIVLPILILALSFLIFYTYKQKETTAKPVLSQDQNSQSNQPAKNILKEIGSAYFNFQILYKFSPFKQPSENKNIKIATPKDFFSKQDQNKRQ